MGRLAGHRIDPFLLAGGKAEEIGHGFRGFVVEQVDFDVTFGGAHDNGSHGPKCLMGLRPGGNAAALAIVRMSRKRAMPNLRLILDKTSLDLPGRFGYLIIVITLYGRITIIYGIVMR